jgi:hypothetical protein
MFKKYLVFILVVFVGLYFFIFSAHLSMALMSQDDCGSDGERVFNQDTETWECEYGGGGSAGSGATSSGLGCKLNISQPDPKELKVKIVLDVNYKKFLLPGFKKRQTVPTSQAVATFSTDSGLTVITKEEKI